MIAKAQTALYRMNGIVLAVIAGIRLSPSSSLSLLVFPTLIPIFLFASSSRRPPGHVRLTPQNSARRYRRKRSDQQHQHQLRGPAGTVGPAHGHRQREFGHGRAANQFQCGHKGCIVACHLRGIRGGGRNAFGPRGLQSLERRTTRK